MALQAQYIKELVLKITC